MPLSRSPSPYNDGATASGPRYGLRRTSVRKERISRPSDHRSVKTVEYLTDHYDGLTGSSTFINDQRPENEYEVQTRGTELDDRYERERRISGSGSMGGRTRKDSGDRRNYPPPRRQHDVYIPSNSPAAALPTSKRPPTNWWKHGKKIERGNRRRDDWEDGRDRMQDRRDSNDDRREARDKGKGREEADDAGSTSRELAHAPSQAAQEGRKLDQEPQEYPQAPSYSVDIPGLTDVGAMQEDFQSFNLNARASTSRHSLDVGQPPPGEDHPAAPRRDAEVPAQSAAYDVPGLATDPFRDGTSQYPYYSNGYDDFQSQAPVSNDAIPGIPFPSTASANPFAYEDQSIMFENHLRSIGQGPRIPRRSYGDGEDDSRRRGRRRSDRPERPPDPHPPELHGSAWDGADAPQNTRVGVKLRRKRSRGGEKQSISSWHAARAPQRIPDFILELPPFAVAAVIGKGGWKIQELMRETQTHCHVDKERPDGPALLVWGQASKLDKVKQRALQWIQEAYPDWESMFPGPSGSNHPPQTSQSPASRRQRLERQPDDAYRETAYEYSRHEQHESEEYGPLLSMEQWSSLDSWRRETAESFEPPFEPHRDEPLEYLASEIPKKQKKGLEIKETEATTCQKEALSGSPAHLTNVPSSISSDRLQLHEDPQSQLPHNVATPASKYLPISTSAIVNKSIKGVRRVSKPTGEDEHVEPPTCPTEIGQRELQRETTPRPTTPPLPRLTPPPKSTPALSHPREPTPAPSPSAPPVSTPPLPPKSLPHHSSPQSIPQNRAKEVAATLERQGQQSSPVSPQSTVEATPLEPTNVVSDVKGVSYNHPSSAVQNSPSEPIPPVESAPDKEVEESSRARVLVKRKKSGILDKRLLSTSQHEITNTQDQSTPTPEHELQSTASDAPTADILISAATVLTTLRCRSPPSCPHIDPEPPVEDARKSGDGMIVQGAVQICEEDNADLGGETTRANPTEVRVEQPSNETAVVQEPPAMQENFNLNANFDGVTEHAKANEEHVQTTACSDASPTRLPPVGADHPSTSKRQHTGAAVPASPTAIGSPAVDFDEDMEVSNALRTHSASPHVLVEAMTVDSTTSPLSNSPLGPTREQASQDRRNVEESIGIDRPEVSQALPLPSPISDGVEKVEGNPPTPKPTSTPTPSPSDSPSTPTLPIPPHSSAKTLFPIFTNDRRLPFHPTTPPATISEGTSDKAAVEALVPSNEPDPRQQTITIFFRPQKKVANQPETDVAAELLKVSPPDVQPSQSFDTIIPLRSPSPKKLFIGQKRKYEEESESEEELDLIDVSLFAPDPVEKEPPPPTPLPCPLTWSIPIKEEPSEGLPPAPVHPRSSLNPDHTSPAPSIPPVSRKTRFKMGRVVVKNARNQELLGYSEVGGRKKRLRTSQHEQ
ncbi:hypothetical protein BT69DRAFT_1331280 [Atractiella rhizophila]|nr:hypothetical protein BT69DRAFT_1331280 [Atractiella rhizophila]